MIKQFMIVFVLSVLTALTTYAENTLVVSFDFIITSASQQNLPETSPILNSILTAGMSVPTKINPKVACHISFVKFDTQKTASGLALAPDTLRIEGVFECSDLENTMAPAVLFQQMRKWIRVDLSEATQLDLHFIVSTEPSVSGSN